MITTIIEKVEYEQLEVINQKLHNKVYNMKYENIHKVYVVKVINPNNKELD